MNTLLIGNAILLAGCGIMACVGLIKQRKKILIVQSIQMGVQAAGNLVLGGVAGCVANVLGILRNLLCLRRELTLALGAGFVAAQAAITLLLDRSGPAGWLPVLGTAAHTFGVNAKDEVKLKCAFIAAQVCWLLYDLWIRGYAGAVFDVITMCANLVGIVTILRERKKKEE